MSDEKVLTKEIAEQFLADEDSVDLAEFTAIEDEAAEVLGQCEDHLNQGLKLSSLTTLSDSAAKHLSNFERDLDLSGIVEMPDETVEILLKNATTLYLSAINDDLAKKLSKRRRLPVLQLKHFPELPGHIALAKAIVREASYSVVALGGVLNVTELHPEVARVFAQTSGHLQFAAVTRLSLESANALSAHKKGTLRLFSLESVSEEVAVALAKHGAKLFLSNLRSIEDTKGHRKLLRKLIKSLDYAEFQFEELPLWLANELMAQLKKSGRTAAGRYDYHLNLPKLLSIDDEVLKVLCEKPDYNFRGFDLRLDALTELPQGADEALALHSGNLSLKSVATISDAVAKVLGVHDGEFDVSGLVQMTPTSAAYLAKTKYKLWLGSLEHVSVEVAEALSQHTGDGIVLNAVKRLEVEAAKALSKYVGPLSLGIEEIDDEQAMNLSLHQNQLGLVRITELTSDAAEHLANHKQEISMISLNVVSEDVAHQLAKHPGPLRINLEKIPGEAADILRNAFPQHRWGVELRK
jgi:hypothetical protein